MGEPYIKVLLIRIKIDNRKIQEVLILLKCNIVNGGKFEKGVSTL